MNAHSESEAMPVEPARHSQSSPSMAIADAWAALRENSRWTAFSWFSLKRRYFRTRLGMVWMPLGFLITLVMLGTLFSIVFGRPMSIYLPHFGYGLACWLFISASIAEADQVFTGNGGLIKEFPLPYSFFAFAAIARNTFGFVMNLTVVAAVNFVYLGKISWTMPLALIAIPIYVVSAYFVLMFLGPIFTRYRDFGPVLGNIIRVFFFMTPVIWLVENREVLADLVAWNPFYHYIQLIRAPMSGELPATANWIAVGSSMLILGLLWLFSFRASTSHMRRWL